MIGFLYCIGIPKGEQYMDRTMHDSAMSVITYVETNAPFLISCGPVLLAIIGTALIWTLLSHKKTPPAVRRDSISVLTQTHGSIDEYVFLDNDPKDDYLSSEPHEEDEHVPYSQVRYTEEEMVRRSDEFYHSMNHRRTVRMFSDKPVPLEVLKNIIHTAGEFLLQILKSTRSCDYLE